MSESMQNSQNSKAPNKSDGHILVVSCPFQGHAAPLIKISHRITKLGTKVTFLTTDSGRALMDESKTWNHGMRIISIPDGLEHVNERKDQREVYKNAQKVMPCYLIDLLKQTNDQSLSNNIDRISGVIIDSPLALMVEIPKKMRIKVAIFWCSSPGCLALGLKIPQLMHDKFIDNNGTPLKNEKIQLLPNMSAMSMTDFMWYFPSDMRIQKEIFDITKGVIHHMKDADWILCNWFGELDSAITDLQPNLLSIGPLLTNGESSGSLFPEDATCLTWLNQQPPNSVVYVAFGSTSRFSQQQLDELANGLELMGRPFLWVAWSGLSNEAFPAYSNEFKQRVSDRGKMVEWAPQEVVLGHSSVACFITHCGWSSFMESISMGVPMLCWPYFGDQMYTQTCICDAWRVGMLLKPDQETGIISRYEIVHKVEQLLCDGIIKGNALKLKEITTKSVNKGGSSLVNLESLLEQMK